MTGPVVAMELVGLAGCLECLLQLVDLLGLGNWSSLPKRPSNGQRSSGVRSTNAVTLRGKPSGTVPTTNAP